MKIRVLLKLITYRLLFTLTPFIFTKILNLKVISYVNRSMLFVSIKLTHIGLLICYLLTSLCKVEIKILESQHCEVK